MIFEYIIIRAICEYELLNGEPRHHADFFLMKFCLVSFARSFAICPLCWQRDFQQRQKTRTKSIFGVKRKFSSGFEVCS